jgi:hypothetical protein
MYKRTTIGSALLVLQMLQQPEDSGPCSQEHENISNCYRCCSSQRTAARAVRNMKTSAIVPLPGHFYSEIKLAKGCNIVFLLF